MTAPDPVPNSSHAGDAPAAARRATQSTAAVAAVLIALKAFALGASGSVSILASLIGSALDLIAALTAIYAGRLSVAGGQDFAKGRGEAAAGLVQAGLIFASSVFVGWAAIQRIFDPRPVAAGGWAVGVTLVAIALTAALIVHRTRVLKSASAQAAEGDGGRAVSDLTAEVVVLIGVASGAWLNAPGLDAAAGLVVAIWLFWGGVGLLKTATASLTAAALTETERAEITHAVLADPRVLAVRALSARRVGAVARVRMQVDLEPALTLAQAHAIVVEAEERVRAVSPGADILIHANPSGAVGVTPTPAPPAAPEIASTPAPASAPAKGPWS